MASKFGLHGDMKHVTLNSGNVEGVFQPYGTKKIMTSRGEKFDSIYDLLVVRRQQAAKAAARRAKPTNNRAQFAPSVKVDVAEFNASETTAVPAFSNKGGWQTKANGSKIRSNTVEASMDRLAACWGTNA